MSYDFDTVIDRRGTSSLKYDGAALRLSDPSLDLLPLWVADMDFVLPSEIKERYEQIVTPNVYGYTFAGDEYCEAVCGWLSRRWGWQVEGRWLVQTPGVVFALGCAVQSLTDPGDAIIVQQPVYHPFSHVVLNNGRTLVNSELVLKDGRYEIDFDDFESKVKENDVKLFILCNPHNPVGRAWSESELRRLGQICLENGVVVVSDEIHGDFNWTEDGHCCFANLGDKFAQNSVVCTAPSKTFNIAGFQASNIVIPNPDLRTRFKGVMEKFGMHGISMPAMAMTRACYEAGGQWLAELRNYLMENLSFMKDYLSEFVPEVCVLDLEATYLPWLDCSGLTQVCRNAGYLEEDQSFFQNQDALDSFVKREAGLWLDPGTMFGSQSPQFERINIACPRSTLKKALDLLSEAVARYR